MKKEGQPRANLRICASCRWVFKLTGKVHHETGGCPKCGFAHYGAYWAMGKRVYKYQYTQEPWKQVRMDKYSNELDREIKETNGIKKTSKNIFKIDLKPSLY